MFEEVFISKIDEENVSLPCVRDIVGVNKTAGTIGLEIECEGNLFRKQNGVVAPWKYVKDGSLRGIDNAEYVLQKPLEFDKIEGAVNKLYEMFKEDGTILDVSNRTSVHVHMNVQDFSLNQLCSFMCLYVSVEDILTHWCGDHRVGNLFCLRARDAEGIISKAKEFFVKDGKCMFNEGMHYAGMNISALYKFGSMEIRSLRGVTDPQTIIDWVSILHRIYTMAKDYNDPRLVIEGFSSQGAMAYLENVLGPHFSTVVNDLPPGFNIHQIQESLISGVRLAQDLAYCRDWSKVVLTDPRKDPFNRRSKEYIQGIEVGMFNPFMAYTQPAIGPVLHTMSEEWLTFNSDTQANTTNYI